MSGIELCDAVSESRIGAKYVGLAQLAAVHAAQGGVRADALQLHLHELS